VQVDGIVNSVGLDFDMTKGALAESVLAKAGPQIQQELQANRRGNPRYGNVVVTRGYGLNAKFVFHGSLKSYKDGPDAEEVTYVFSLLAKFCKLPFERMQVRIGSLNVRKICG
jgi:O-acetyl-ADP-ribose deacetylase (regulator of RNase III)